MKARIPVREIIVGIIILHLVSITAFSGDWHEEFDEICSRVEIADTLSSAELQSLVERSDALLKQLESSDDPSVKVYVFRLKKCRDFFAFTLDLKK